MEKIEIRDAEAPTGGIAEIVVRGRPRLLSQPHLVIQNRQTGEFISKDDWVRGASRVAVAGQRIEGDDLVLQLDGPIVDNVLKADQLIVIGIPELEMSEIVHWPEVIADFSGNAMPATQVFPVGETETETASAPGGPADTAAPTGDGDDPTSSRAQDPTSVAPETAADRMQGRDAGDTATPDPADGRDLDRHPSTGTRPDSGAERIPQPEPRRSRRSGRVTLVLAAFVAGAVLGGIATRSSILPWQVEALNDQIDTLRGTLDAAEVRNNALLDEVAALRARPDAADAVAQLEGGRDALAREVAALERLYLDIAEGDGTGWGDTSPSGRAFDAILGDFVAGDDPGNLLYQTFREESDLSTPLDDEEVFLLTGAVRFGSYQAEAALASHYLSLTPITRDDVVLAIHYFKSAANTLRALGDDAQSALVLDRAEQAFLDHRALLLSDP